MNIDFLNYIKTYRKIIPILLVSALISYLAVFYSNIAPPIHNKDAIFFISIIIESTAIIKIYKDKITKTSFGAFMLLAFLIIYFSAHTLMTFKIPTSDTTERDVKGFVCSTNAKIVYKEECPMLSLEALQESSFEPDKLWQNWSIALSKVILVLLWSFFIWFAARNIASLVFSLNKSQNKKKRSSKPL